MLTEHEAWTVILEQLKKPIPAQTGFAGLCYMVDTLCDMDKISLAVLHEMSTRIQNALPRGFSYFEGTYNDRHYYSTNEAARLLRIPIVEGFIRDCAPVAPAFQAQMNTLFEAGTVAPDCDIP